MQYIKDIKAAQSFSEEILHGDQIDGALLIRKFGTMINICIPDDTHSKQNQWTAMLLQYHATVNV